MSYLDNRRMLDKLSLAIYQGNELPEEREYLVIALFRIATGEDANEVLGVKPTTGRSERDAIAKQRISFILHWVRSYMDANPASDEKRITLEEACIEAEKMIVPVAKKRYPGADMTQYTAEYIQRCHTSPRYKHMRSEIRRWTDDDFPYE